MCHVISTHRRRPVGWKRGCGLGYAVFRTGAGHADAASDTCCFYTPAQGAAPYLHWAAGDKKVPPSSRLPCRNRSFWPRWAIALTRTTTRTSNASDQESDEDHPCDEDDDGDGDDDDDATGRSLYLRRSRHFHLAPTRPLGTGKIVGTGTCARPPGVAWCPLKKCAADPRSVHVCAALPR